MTQRQFSGTPAENSAQISIKDQQYACLDTIWFGLTRYTSQPVNTQSNACIWITHTGHQITCLPEDGRYGFGTAT